MATSRLGTISSGYLANNLQSTRRRRSDRGVGDVCKERGRNLIRVPFSHLSAEVMETCSAQPHYDFGLRNAFWKQSPQTIKPKHTGTTLAAMFAPPYAVPGLLVIIVLMNRTLPTIAYRPPNEPMIIKSTFVMTPSPPPVLLSENRQ